MEIFNIGQDEICDYIERYVNSDKYDWLVYSYNSGFYEGNGQAVGLTKTGELHYWSLSHCSCYGPFETMYGNAEPEVISINDLIKDLNSVHAYYEYNIVEKVIALYISHLISKLDDVVKSNMIFSIIAMLKSSIELNYGE